MSIISSKNVNPKGPSASCTTSAAMAIPMASHMRRFVSGCTFKSDVLSVVMVKRSFLFGVPLRTSQEFNGLNDGDRRLGTACDQEPVPRIRHKEFSPILQPVRQNQC